MEVGSRSGPDPELVRAAANHDQRALNSLVAASLPLVYNIVGRALNGHADTDDVVQETLLRMVRYLPDLREPEAYRSWLVAIALRQVRDHEHGRRTTMARRVELSEHQDVPDAASDFAGLTILRLGLTDQRREVAEATRWLADEDQSLLALWWLEEAGELGRTELARAMDLSGAHVAVRVARMKDQMQTARAVVRALHAQPRCPELTWSISAWDGAPSPLWRKRIARHIRDCSACGQRAGGMLPMERLLAGTAMLPVPPALTERFSNFLPKGTPSAGHVGRTAGRLRHLVPAGSHAAIAAAAVAVVIAGAIVVVQVSGQASAPPRVAAAASAPAPVVLATPLPPPAGSASPSKSPSRSPSPAATPSHSPVPAVPAAPAVSYRKGVSAWSFTGVDKALKRSGASWYYTWSTGHSGITTPRGVQFVPMIWGPGSVTTSALAQAKAVGGDLLGFNEPDLGSQSNMTVAQALDLWPQLEATGMTLGSPAVASGGATAGGWLDQFMTGAAKRGYRVD
ncbi:MAG TPA: sigma-70 family RNA polymerase sigma factor, partial [Micromonosporaceae bacterium]